MFISLVAYSGYDRLSEHVTIIRKSAVKRTTSKFEYQDVGVLT